LNEVLTRAQASGRAAAGRDLDDLQNQLEQRLRELTRIRLPWRALQTLQQPDERLSYRASTGPAADLVARAQAGRPDAFGSSIVSITPAGLRALSPSHGDGRDAEERTQESSCGSGTRLRTFRGDSAFSSWLHRLTVNVVLTNAHDGPGGSAE